MVKDATSRINKYNAKIDPDAVRIRFNLQGAQMKENQIAKQTELAQLNGQVRAILDASASPNAVASCFSMPYQAYANELYGKSKKFTGLVFTQEADIVSAKWTSRGLNATVMASIRDLFVED